MLKQEILNAVDVIMANPMIESVSINLRSYAEPQISIQSHKDVPEYLVVALVERNLGEIKLANVNMDFSHCNCWGNSFYGFNDGVEIRLITSTTKEKPSAPTESQKETTFLNSTTEMSIPEMVGEA